MKLAKYKMVEYEIATLLDRVSICNWLWLSLEEIQCQCTWLVMSTWLGQSLYITFLTSSINFLADSFSPVIGAGVWHYKQDCKKKTPMVKRILARICKNMDFDAQRTDFSPTKLRLLQPFQNFWGEEEVQS